MRLQKHVYDRENLKHIFAKDVFWDILITWEDYSVAHVDFQVRINLSNLGFLLCKIPPQGVASHPAVNHKVPKSASNQFGMTSLGMRLDDIQYLLNKALFLEDPIGGTMARFYCMCVMLGLFHHHSRTPHAHKIPNPIS